MGGRREDRNREALIQFRRPILWRWILRKLDRCTAIFGTLSLFFLLLALNTYCFYDLYEIYDMTRGPPFPLAILHAHAVMADAWRGRGPNNSEAGI